MASPPSEKNSETVPTLSLLDRFFSNIERFAYLHSWLVIIVSVVLAAASIWITVNKLTFKTGRSDLVAKNLPYVNLYDQYREEFDDFEGMIVVVENQKPEVMKSFAEDLVKKIKERPEIFSKVFYKIDTQYFKDRALLYLDQEDLLDLRGTLESHEAFLKKINAAPGLNQLLIGLNDEISTGMVDSLLSDFLGGSDEKSNEGKDLTLLYDLLKQMTAHLQDDPQYRSPWRQLFTDQGESLEEEGYLVSDDEKLLFILLIPEEDKTVFTGFDDSIKFTRKLIAETKASYPGIQVGLTGEDVIASDEMVTTQIDVKEATQLALAGVALLFIVAYRGVVKPLMAVFCLLIAISWTMGYATLTVGHLNILSVVFTTILIGLGIDFGIHILERYREERSQGSDILPALQKTVQGTGRGNFSGAITTAMAFGAMTLTDFIGIAELGWIAAGGILFCMFAMLLLLPALITVEEKWRKPNYALPAYQKERPSRLEAFFNHYFIIIAASVLLVILSALSLRDARFDYNILNLQAKGTEAVRYELKIMDNAKRSAWSAAIITDSLEDAVRMKKTLLRLPTVGRVEGIVSTLPENQNEKSEIIETLKPILAKIDTGNSDAPFHLKPLLKTLDQIRFKLQGSEEGSPKFVAENAAGIKRFLAELESVDPEEAEKRLAAFSTRLFSDFRDQMGDLKAGVKESEVRVEDLPPLLRSRFVSKKGRYLLSVFPSVNIWKIEARQKFLKELREADPNVTGNAIHMFESSRLMKNGYIMGGFYAMGAIVLYVLLAFRNARTALFILLPVGAGSLWTLGIMDLMDLQFNLANLVILPLIIGIGVVNGIHIVHRFREEGDKNVTVMSKSTGQAVVLSSLTTMIGFGSMMIADHQGIYSLGLLLTIGVGSCLVASITFLPALLKLCAVKGWKV